MARAPGFEGDAVPLVNPVMFGPDIHVPHVEHRQPVRQPPQHVHVDVAPRFEVITPYIPLRCSVRSAQHEGGCSLCFCTFCTVLADV